MTSRDLAHHARLVMTRSPRRSAERWRRALPGPRIGACAAWPRQLATPPQRSIASGRPSACSRIAARRSSCRAIRCSFEKVRDIVGLYLDPPDRAVVLCIDEKSQIQALDRTQPLLPMRPGQAERRTHDYKRHGTISLFAALDVQVGKVIGRCFRRHRAQEFRKFLDTVEAQVPDDLDVHLIIDNAGTHKTRGSEAGSPNAPAGTFTSRRPRPPGSTRSSASSAYSPNARCAAAYIAPPQNSKPPSTPTLRRTMQTQNPSDGSSPPTTSLPPSIASAAGPSKQTPHCAELRNQDTSAMTHSLDSLVIAGLDRIESGHDRQGYVPFASLH